MNLLLTISTDFIEMIIWISSTRWDLSWIIFNVNFDSDILKQKKLEKLVETKEKTIASDRYLQRIILGDTVYTSEQQQKVQAHYQNSKAVQPIR